MFREGGFSPQPDHEKITPATPEKKDVFSNIKEELRHLLPKILLVATVATCGDKEDRQAQTFIEHQKQELTDRNSSDAQNVEPRIAVVDTASGEAMPQEVKAFLDQTFDTPQDPVMIVPHIEGEEGPVVLHAEASEHHDMHATHHYDDDISSESTEPESDHVHSDDVDMTSDHEHEETSDRFGLASDSHAHTHDQGIGVSSSPHASEQDHNHGHAHFDVLTGGTITNALGETTTEILDLHGHTNFQMADANGVWNVGLGKSTQRFSGHEDVHASVGAAWSEPVYGYVTPGAEVELGSEGAALTLSVTSAEKDGSQWWAGVRTGGGEHAHEDHVRNDEAHEDHEASKQVPEHQPDVTLDLTENVHTGGNDEHSEREGVEIAEEIMQRLNMGTRGKVIGDVSMTGGMEHGGWYSRFDLPVKIEGRDVRFSLLTRVELGHDGGKENAGVFFRIKGEL